MKRKPQIMPGDVVQFSAEHCRNTGQFAGPDAPTDIGPHARGVFKGIAHDLGNDFGVVDWDNGRSRTVHVGNLWPVGIPEPV